MDKLVETIEKYKLKSAYKGVVNPVEGIIPGIVPPSEELEFIKQNKAEILTVLKRMKKNQEQQVTKDYKEKRNAELKEKYPAEFEKAANENTDIEIGSWQEPCNDPKEECNLDFVFRYVKPDGSVYVKRQHTN